MIQNNKFNVLIPNATSPRNMGDLAILHSLLDLLKKSNKNLEVKIQSVDPGLHEKSDNISQNFYEWAVFRNKNNITRSINLFKIAIQYLIIKLGLENKISIDGTLSTLIQEYKNTDTIIYVGGGYLRSRKGLSQMLNLFMLLLPFIFSKPFSKKTIVAPISFGPFAYKWQEKIVAEVLRGMNIVSLREKISYKRIQKYGLKNIILSTDHAFLLGKIKNNEIKKHKKRRVLGFTIRYWGEKNNFSHFENSFVLALEKFSRKTKVLIKPIVQVDAPMYGENDLRITRKIVATLKKRGINVLKAHMGRNLNSLLGAYSEVDLLLGMRMHSNILAITQDTPIVAIAYEHKTEGITKQFGLSEYCVSFDEVSKDVLYKRLIKAYRDRKIMSKRTSVYLDKIQKYEIDRWVDLLSSINN